LSSLRNGSLPWNQELAARARDLTDAFSCFSPEDITKAVEAELRQRAHDFATGVRLYKDHPRKGQNAAKTTHVIGTTRLLDFGERAKKNATPILIIPSLVNRYTVLDLNNGHSFIRMLTTQGYHPFVVDWDAPGPEEQCFNLTDYILQRLEPLLAVVQKQTGGKPVGLMGYCMGGLLALALATRQPRSIRALTLLATPWDFHTGFESRIKTLSAMMPQLNTLIDSLGMLPVDVLQAMFTSLDPWLTQKKFQHFSHMAPDGLRAQSFVDLEDWLNDGVPLAGSVARDCLQGWYVENQPFKGQWEIDGKPVLPQELLIPSLSVIPGRDHIVPPASARALSNALPRGDSFVADAGHIGMIAGGRAKQVLHDPLLAWLGKNLQA